ncbi:MAG TPA: 2-phosphosulfolactate phosphatase [Cytophagaceae bacterium]|jgi:2-phosphosulfolactate phosphatase|nr:2-phosphosulfolactate phosphatase [Cytophagaceae bacterium]
MKNIEVCLSPALLDLYGVENKVVVVVDILRATSCMTTGLAHGLKSIIPVASLDECSNLRAKGFIAAAERDGKMADGFDLGNSPFSYMDKSLVGKSVAMTTTNGTQAISKSLKAEEIIIGSFLNKTSVINYLLAQSSDVLVLCAGWKGQINLEDTLFAGALVEGVGKEFASENDSAMTAYTLYQAAKGDLSKFLSNSSHVRRLRKLNIIKDIDFCLQSDVYHVIPILKGGELVKMEMREEMSVKTIR